MTLNKIKVKNFQSIEAGEVELGSFTVFTGPSSSGKSAFLRAAQAVVRNSFTPTQVRMGAKETEVSVQFDDHLVTAYRGKSKSTYRLDDEEFTKAGRTVPPAVAEAFKMPEVAEVESSFATQFDKPYLIADPGSVAAKVLGTLTNVSVLHSGLRETNRRGLEVKSRLKVKSADLDTVRDRLESYEGLDLEIAEASKLQEEYILLKETQLRAEALDKLLRTTASLTERLQQIEESQVDVTPLATTLESLTEDIQKTDSLTTILASVKKLAAGLPTWEYDSVPEYDSSMDTALARLQGMDDLLNTLTRSASSYKRASATSHKAHAAIQEKQGEFDKLMEGISECPLCNSPLNGEHLD